ncbi:hypothetical protein THAOC_14650 [Thalassiosira oceanica]|uniref:Uncharacterized protein n=1 Tax=Thalassiosira oceanica TaxID=159749 RepID=K0T2E4_THAOC|nr:hypothetical protein THAOC_14650 [Thalassiosira oceanica]|eukprot:EJK64602.1 hypothetical protein THAOC_14650 [Thalassiosira oceanica]
MLMAGPVADPPTGCSIVGRRVILGFSASRTGWGDERDGTGRRPVSTKSPIGFKPDGGTATVKPARIRRRQRFGSAETSTTATSAPQAKGGSSPERVAIAASFPRSSLALRRKDSTRSVPAEAAGSSSSRHGRAGRPDCYLPRPIPGDRTSPGGRLSGAREER